MIIIENLVKNAIDAMKGKGSLAIAISELEDVVKIKITDSGKGIPKNQFSKVSSSYFSRSLHPHASSAM